MLFSDGVAIIADDLTGANDTALQFHIKGCTTKVLTNYKSIDSISENTQVWAVSTESRNIDSETAKQRAKEATADILQKFNVEYLYKKIDSTIRGNISAEIMGILEASNYEAAIIMPAFPYEGRITVGGYHLLKGQLIERTEIARDPSAPIYESHIPTVLKTGLEPQNKDIVALIELNTVKQGAGPILFKLNELLAAGKKLIVADAASSVDIEQVMLALQKCNKKILPCGSAGAAQALCEIVFPKTTYNKAELEIPKLPKLIVSGSASALAAQQLKRLASDEDIENTYFIEITPEQILNPENDDIVERAVNNLNKTNTVVIHTSTLFSDLDAMTVMLFEKEISRDAFISMICDYLAEITNVILHQKEAILVTVGGETTYKCLDTLNINSLKIIDEVVPSIPLCMDSSNRYFVTKAGNLGNSQTLCEVVKYFEKM
ncbi:MAG: four-carbon acid sugar kinase family protein [Candidatus Gastranaerophilales bacterium]|nr:four-carbon acid sugar kinase family protein [Candidatus Gastranaerophilales bacterium]